MSDVENDEITADPRFLTPRHRVTYCCPLCSKQMHERRTYMNHMARKTPCNEARGTAWLRINIKDNLQIQLKELDNKIIEFKNQASMATCVQDVNELRKMLSNLRYRLNTIKARVRIICYEDYNDPYKYDSELDPYQEKIEKLRELYKLLVF